MTELDTEAARVDLAGHRFEVEIRELMALADLVACVGLQRSVWQALDIEIVPVSQLRATQLAGGLVGGAFADGELIGFCYGFPSFRPELHQGPGLHSHMVGVAATARGQGVGRALKQFQRRWCMKRNLRWIEWTFDPLRAANARLNLEHLGAIANEYLVDVYGSMEDGLNSGLPSDRLMAFWALDAEGSEPRPAEEYQPEQIERVLSARSDGGPAEPKLHSPAPAVAVQVPADLSKMMAETPEIARDWRHASRAAFLHYLGAGYVAVRFVAGAFVLERPEEI